VKFWESSESCIKFSNLLEKLWENDQNNPTSDPPSFAVCRVACRMPHFANKEVAEGHTSQRY